VPSLYEKMMTTVLPMTTTTTTPKPFHLLKEAAFT
jgi:hypothetical protein